MSGPAPARLAALLLGPGTKGVDDLFLREGAAVRLPRLLRDVLLLHREERFASERAVCGLQLERLMRGCRDAAPEPQHPLFFGGEAFPDERDFHGRRPA